MGKLRKRSTAAAVAAAVIVVSTLLGVRVSAGKATKKVEQMFFSGVYTTYFEPSIANLLDDRVNASNGLLTMTAGHEELTGAADKLRKARRELIEAETIAQKAEANRRLEAAYRDCVDALGKTALDERDRGMLEKYAGQMSGAQSAIEKSSYNDKVAELRRELGWFPMGVLTRVLFAPSPQYFE